MTLRLVPVTLEDANEFVRQHHRHHRPVTGQKFSVAVARPHPFNKPDSVQFWTVCGVAIASRPVAPKLDDGSTLEITRCCTDGTKNACSMLYGALRRAGRALGYTRILTYTLPEEGGGKPQGGGLQDRQGRRRRAGATVAQPARSERRARG